MAEQCIVALDEEARELKRKFPDAAIVAPGHAITGRRFFSVMVTDAARQHIRRHPKGRPWWNEVMPTRLAPGAELPEL